jgi:hypothetical protein
MRNRVDPPAELRRLAELQAGVVTREQAEGHGFSRHSQQRLVDQGEWQRLLRGVLLTGSHKPEWLTLAWAGVLRGGDEARLGGLAAAFQHQLIDHPPKTIVVLVPRSVRPFTADPWRLLTERPQARRARSVGALARTTIEDTVLDLCDGRIEPDDRHHTAHWLTAAVQRRLTTSDRLLRALEARSRISGRRLLLEMLTDVDEGAESPLELKYLRDVERAHGLPSGVRQAPALSDGHSARRDVRYREYGLLVELDGELGHAGESRFRDFRRDNAALLTGEMTLRYGWTDVDAHPCSIARQVAELLTRGGWPGPFLRCPNCRAMP